MIEPRLDRDRNTQLITNILGDQIAQYHEGIYYLIKVKVFYRLL